MAKCCGAPPNPLVVMVPKEKTCKVNKPALNIFNQYNLNKQQVMKANNTIDFTTTKVIKAMGKDAVSKIFKSFFDNNYIIKSASLIAILLQMEW